MNLQEIKFEFGKQLVFQCGISIQKILPFGTIFEIQNEVKNVIQTLATSGGYILCTSHNIETNVFNRKM